MTGREGLLLTLIVFVVAVTVAVVVDISVVHVLHGPLRLQP